MNKRTHNRSPKGNGIYLPAEAPAADWALGN
jgi:hypothetical protein